MKKQVELVILLLFGLAFLVYLFPFIFVEAAKLQSGVTITAPTTKETEKICDDRIDNDNDEKIDADDEDCAAAPASPSPWTCNLQISGFPINYGPLSPGGYSATKEVRFANPGGYQIGRIVIKGGNWISDSDPKSTISGPQMTHVTRAPFSPPLPPWEQRPALTSSGLPFEMFFIPFGSYIPIYFQIKVPSSAISGSFHQEVEISCGL